MDRNPLRPVPSRLLRGIGAELIYLWHPIHETTGAFVAAAGWYARRGDGMAFVIFGEPVKWFGPFKGEDECRQWCQQKNAEGEQ